MKKVLLSVFAVAAMAFGVQAQESAIIPKVGVSFATMSGSDVESEDKQQAIGFVAGMGFQLGISEMFSVQPELLFIQKGNKYKSGDLSSTAKFSYVEIPVLAKFSFGSAYVNVGPSFGYALSGKSVLKFGGEKESESIEFGGDDGASRMDMGLQFGAGNSFEVGSGKLVIDARYGWGLSSIGKNMGETMKAYNRAITLTVGYAIPLGGK